jgi:hypothetical protein
MEFGEPRRRRAVKRVSAESLAGGIVLAKGETKIHMEINNAGIMPKKRENMTADPFPPDTIPVRRGSRPKTLIGPLHIQCNGHGDPKYLNQLVDDVLTWPHVESTPPASRLDTIPIRLEEAATTSNSSAFISTREFARVLLGAPTIYLALPLVSAHWAIVRGWAEPHYLRSFGLMPAGAVLVYTPKDPAELAVCYSLFAEAYNFACRFGKDE